MRIYISIVVVLFFYNNAITQCVNPDLSIWNNTWQSCEFSQNPNPDRGEGHWIQYDLGAIYNLSKTHVWNTNEVGKTQNGFRNVIVDYSEDGTTWKELGTFDFSQGTGEAIYGGFEGFDFGGIPVRYVIITATSNWGGNCFGIAEVKFNLLIDMIEDDSQGGECTTIDEVNIEDVTDFTALINWSEVQEAEGYLVLFRPVGEEEWDEIEVEEAEILLDDLDDATEYEIQIIVICADEEESEESESYFFTTLGEGTTNVEDININVVSKLLLIPNPATANVNLLFDSKIKGQGTIYLRNVNGSIVKQASIFLDIGKNNHRIAINNFASGVYSITLENQEQEVSLTKRLMIFE